MLVTLSTPPAAVGSTRILAQRLEARTMAQAPQGYLFDLADASAGELEMLADFWKLKGEKNLFLILYFLWIILQQQDKESQS